MEKHLALARALVAVAAAVVEALAKLECQPGRPKARP
jgi:hypothetical protein